MPNPWKSKVLAFNKRRAEADERAQDLLTLLNALPPGQRKQLLKDPACAPILNKYGVTEDA